MMEHKCEANEGGTHVEFWPKDQKWHLSTCGTLLYCPYCGIKLEKPDEKIEVSRNALREVVDQLWIVHEEDAWGGHRTDAPERVFAQCQRINKMLRDAEREEGG